MLEVLINPCAGGQVRRAKEAVERQIEASEQFVRERT